MSLAAIDNYLCGGAIQKRFMADPSMAAYRGFIEEKVPVGGVLLRRRGSEPPEKPARAPVESWEKHGGDTDPASPECTLLSNGVYHVMLTNSWLSSASAGCVGIYRGPADPLAGRGGIGFSLLSEDGGTPVSRFGDDRLPTAWTFSGKCAVLSGGGESLSYRCIAAVSAGDTAELRLVEISAKAGFRGRLVLSFAPGLANYIDYVNHPAFYRLGLHAGMRSGSLIIRRLPRNGLPGCCICLACDQSMELSANDGGKPLGWLSAPLVRASVSLDLPENGVFSVHFALGFGASPEEAYVAAQRTLSMGASDYADLSSACASLYGMTVREAAAAMGMVSALSFPHVRGPVTEGREALWRLGLSGDLPIIAAEIGSSEQLPAARELIRRHALLRACGLKSDLVFLTVEGGDYLRTISRSVSDTLAKIGLESLYGAFGGVRTADSGAASDILRKSAAVLIDLSAPEAPRKPVTGRHYRKRPASRRGGSVNYRWTGDGAFQFDVAGLLPQRAWANLLVNERFGFIATDAGTGNMWYQNAREFRINAWTNDPRAASGPETLEILYEGNRISLFAAEDGYPCRVTFSFGTAVWEKRIGEAAIRTTAFVPPDIAARVLIVEGAPAEVFWSTGLVLAGDDRDAGTVFTTCDDGAFTARNARSQSRTRRFARSFPPCPPASPATLPPG